MNAKHGVWIVVGAACSACAPLQQAPLVYSSKITVGVDVAGTSTETPGFSFAVGYKQVDAAYVPVAVAKPCDTGQANIDCSSPIYALQTLEGTTTTEGSHQTGPSEAQAKDDIRRYDEARKAATVARLTADDTKLALGVATKRVGALRARQPAAAASAPLFTEAEQLEMANADTTLKTLQTAQTAAAQAATDAQAAADKLQPKAVEAQQILDTLNRKDAYSVYGRFEGEIVGKSSEASVGLGKVFSTGVASQSLAAGLQKYYEGLGSAACFDSVAKLAIADETKKLDLLATCRAK